MSITPQEPGKARSFVPQSFQSSYQPKAKYQKASPFKRKAKSSEDLLRDYTDFAIDGLVGALDAADGEDDEQETWGATALLPGGKGKHGVTSGAEVSARAAPSRGSRSIRETQAEYQALQARVAKEGAPTRAVHHELLFDAESALEDARKAPVANARQNSLTPSAPPQKQSELIDPTLSFLGMRSPSLRPAMQGFGELRVGNEVGCLAAVGAYVQQVLGTGECMAMKQCAYEPVFVNDSPYDDGVNVDEE